MHWPLLMDVCKCWIVVCCNSICLMFPVCLFFFCICLPVALWRHLWYWSGRKRSGNRVQPHIPQRQRQEVRNAEVLNRAPDRTAHRGTGEEKQLHLFAVIIRDDWTELVCIFLKKISQGVFDVVCSCFLVQSWLHIFALLIKRNAENLLSVGCTVSEGNACKFSFC